MTKTEQDFHIIKSVISALEREIRIHTEQLILCTDGAVTDGAVDMDECEARIDDHMDAIANLVRQRDGLEAAISLLVRGA